MDRDRLTPAEMQLREREDEQRAESAKAVLAWNEQHVPKPTDKTRFEEFLRAAGFKCANLGSTIGGACKNTPADRVYLMLIGNEGTEYRLGCRDEPFVFDHEGALYLALSEAIERSAPQQGDPE